MAEAILDDLTKRQQHFQYVILEYLSNNSIRIFLKYLLLGQLAKSKI